jgi:hypothetical protein
MRHTRLVAVAILQMMVAAVALAESKAAPAPAPAPTPSDSVMREAVREGWPATRAGELAHRWVKAFSTGEKAMKQCLADIMAPESLAKTGVAVRVERYRDLHEKYGTLTLVSVEKSDPGQVEATLTASDMTEHHFIFNVQTQAPYKLSSVAMREAGHMGMPGFGH